MYLEHFTASKELTQEIEKITKRVVENIRGRGDYLYHSLYLNGEKHNGKRDCVNRLNKLALFPRYRSICDIGCNTGGMLWPIRFFTPWVVGIEKNKSNVDLCNDLAKLYWVDGHTKFFEADVDNDMKEFDYLGQFDIIFFLAMTQHLKKHWREVIEWVCRHSKLLVIEYNGQPDQIKEYMEYTKTLRKGMDFLYEEEHRYMYLSYDPIIFNLGGKTYETYKLNTGINCEVYYSTKENTIIKIFHNERWEDEVKWCRKLEHAPEIYFVDGDRGIVIQEFCGTRINNYNTPDDYIEQVEAIKRELKNKNCTGADVEPNVKDGKIKIVDLSACTEGNIGKRLDTELEYVRFRRAQYLAGERITRHNNKGI